MSNPQTLILADANSEISLPLKGSTIAYCKQGTYKYTCSSISLQFLVSFVFCNELHGLQNKTSRNKSHQLKYNGGKKYKPDKHASFKWKLYLKELQKK